jgi:hypothetical protein
MRAAVVTNFHALQLAHSIVFDNATYLTLPSTFRRAFHQELGFRPQLADVALNFAEPRGPMDSMEVRR